MILEQLATLINADGGFELARLLVSHLAVRGQLVSQDPSFGKVSYSDFISETAEPNKFKAVENPPFPIPLSWTWLPLGLASQLQNGNAFKSQFYQDDGIPLIRISNLSRDSGLVEIDQDTKRLPHSFWEEFQSFQLRDGDLLIAMSGATTGKTSVFKANSRALLNQRVGRFVINDPERLNNNYLYLLVDWLSPQILAAAYGGAQPNISGKKIEAFPVPIPPLPEQKRIVARVEELTDLCNRLEKAHQTRNKLRADFTASALDNITQAQNPDQLKPAWTIIKNNFPTITATPDSIQKLRQTILQLAVQGKLAPQDPDDAAAQGALAEIQHKKKELIKAKEIRKRKKLPALADSEKPFALPLGWAWSRLEDLIYTVADGPHYSPKYVPPDRGVPFLSARNITVSGFVPTNLKFVSFKDHAKFCERVRPAHGDILYTKGGTTGVALVNELDFEFSIWVHVACLKTALPYVNAHYLALALNSPHCYAQSQEYTHGIGNKDLGLTRMVKISVPVPPLLEQKRIVAKVNELLATCDRLEDALRVKNEKAAAFAQSVIAHELAADPAKVRELAGI